MTKQKKNKQTYKQMYWSFYCLQMKCFYKIRLGTIWEGRREGGRGGGVNEERFKEQQETHNFLSFFQKKN